MAARHGARVDEAGVLWVYDTVHLRVAVDVRPEGVPPEFEMVLVQATHPLPARGDDPWSAQWMHERGPGRGPFKGRLQSSEPPPPGGPASFLVRVPRLPRIAVTAWKEGWRPADATIEIPPELPEIPIRLTLTPGFRIAGVLRDEAGKPVRGLELRVFVLREIPWDRERDSEIPALVRTVAPEGGVAIRTTKRGTLCIRVQERAVTDEEGRFLFHTKSEGRVGIFASEPGRIPIRVDLGPVTEDRDAVEIESPGLRSGPTVQVLYRREPLCSTALVCTDGTDPYQAFATVTTDSEGRLPAAWFLEGHNYNLRLFGLAGLSSGGYFRWQGATSIDLALLPREAPDDWD